MENENLEQEAQLVETAKQEGGVNPKPIDVNKELEKAKKVSEEFMDVIVENKMPYREALTSLVILLENIGKETNKTIYDLFTDMHLLTVTPPKDTEVSVKVKERYNGNLVYNSVDNEFYLVKDKEKQLGYNVEDKSATVYKAGEYTTEDILDFKNLLDVEEIDKWLEEVRKTYKVGVIPVPVDEIRNISIYKDVDIQPQSEPVEEQTEESL